MQSSSGSWLSLKEDEEDGAVDCTGVGIGNVCSSDPEECDSIFLCFPGRPPIKAMCPPGRTCNAGNCTVDQSLLCEYKSRNFKCSTEGMYPEPSSCKKYNYCLPPGNQVPIQGICNKGWAYNPANTFCDKPLLDDTCTASHRVIPTCLSVGQNAALNSNPVLYYICLPYSNEDSTLYPFIFKCPEDTKYVGNYICK